MTTSSPIPWKYLLYTAIRYLPFWGGITLLFGGLGVAYSVFRVDTWEASQPLLIRDEATGAAERLGRFASQTELIAAQETILEMARNREVVERALRIVGPPENEAAENWPSAKVVDEIATSQINVRAPKSSEFGKTEVVYLVTKADSPSRSIALCNAVYSALSEHLRNVRRVRADSLIVELVDARNLARKNLDDATKELQKLETAVGTDLGELRGLSESISGEGNSSRVLSELQRDLRIAELELQKVEALHLLLLRSYDNPSHLLVSDGDLLATQPTLQRLKSGLIDAQLAASQLSGRVLPEHPTMHSAKLALETIRDELRKEILSVTQSMGPSLELARDKVKALNDKQNSIQQKLARLASIRADYSGLVAAVKQRTEFLSAAQGALAEAEAMRSAALSTNLLSELGPARASEKPVGPGRTMLTTGAAAAGLLFGIGGVFLIAPGPNSQLRGRRLSDRPIGRRASDSMLIETPTPIATSVPILNDTVVAPLAESMAFATADNPVAQIAELESRLADRDKTGVARESFSTDVDPPSLSNREKSTLEICRLVAELTDETHAESEIQQTDADSTPNGDEQQAAAQVVSTPASLPALTPASTPASTNTSGKHRTDESAGTIVWCDKPVVEKNLVDTGPLGKSAREGTAKNNGPQSIANNRASNDWGTSERESNDRVGHERAALGDNDTPAQVKPVDPIEVHLSPKVHDTMVLNLSEVLDTDQTQMLSYLEQIALKQSIPLPYQDVPPTT